MPSDFPSFDAASESAETLRQRVVANPKNADAHFQLAEFYFNQQSFNEAEAAYQAAIDLDKTLTRAYLGLGSVLLNKGKLPEAVAAFETAVQLDPQNAEPYFYLGNALDDAGKNDEAITALEKAITLRPEFGEAYLALGFLYFRLGKRSEVQRQYDALMQFDTEMAKQLQSLL
jgi:protein O-GlcNAc transferase